MFVKVKVSELSGPALDWAVAQCAVRDYVYNDVHYRPLKQSHKRDEKKQAGPKFSTSKIHGENLMRSFDILTAKHSQDKNLMWKAWIEGESTCSYGPTHLIAAMRRLVEDLAFVANLAADDFYGFVIEVPVELVGKAYTNV